MSKIIDLYDNLFNYIYKYNNDIFKLFARLYVADAFFRAGLLKIQSWDSTLYLFEEEYQVPFIHWELAAYLGTIVELVLPIFLVLGLLTRLAAFKLFIFNIVAVISYPAIWDGGFYDHKLWGILLLVNVVFGSGKFSFDRFIFKKYT